ncbi:MAG: hypothetical protein A2156_15295 [Deltaproteobacteria bacterium RBG_16_48_10]|nr:MAG: hypothetical protein A2156_15295 [Deltaproteobacteria bacterium RBG_16_48_10]
MILIGTSGYNYPHWWNGIFYPAGLPQRKWLEFYAEHFDTVELNVSFYRLPAKEVFKNWSKRTPRHFSFGLKGSRFITHIKRLKECREPLSLLMEHASPLKEKLGAVLWQLPPRFRFQKERLEEFCVLLSTLPRSKSLRHAFEFRDESWFCREAIQILEEFKFALCVAHGSGLPYLETVTSEFIYLRLHGGETLYGSNYSDQELREWAVKIQGWEKGGKTVFVYFNNDAYGFAIKNALTLKKLTSS